MPRRGSGKKLFFVIFLILAVLFLMKSTELKRVQMPPLEGVWRDFLAPVQKVCVRVTNRLENILAHPVALFNASRQNEQLTREIAELKGRLQVLEECRLENERLKKLLDIQTKSPGNLKVTAATVIGRDPGNWFKTVTLNKGSRQGVEVNMTVLVPEGLVGRVIRVSDNTAQVMLITDPRSAISSLVQETRSPGIVEGTADTSGRLRMIHIPYDVFVRKGQTVVTSGLGSFFPKGIVIGQIMEVKKDPTGLFYNAVIQPAVDFNRLEEVLVVTEVGGGPSA